MACGVASWRKSSSPRDILPCETPAHTPRTVVSARKSPHHQTVPAHTDGLIVARTARNKPAPFALRSAHPLPTCPAASLSAARVEIFFLSAKSDFWVVLLVESKMNWNWKSD